jgi:hypothetical protein
VGFAAVALAIDGTVEATIKGPLAYPRQTVPAGGLMGSMIGLKASANHARAEKTQGRDVEIGNQCFDCSLIQKGMKRGREWCTKADRPLADIWRKWWKQLDRCGGIKGGMGEQLKKVKAHTTAEQIGTVISAIEPCR